MAPQGGERALREIRTSKAAGAPARRRPLFQPSHNSALCRCLAPASPGPLHPERPFTNLSQPDATRQAAHPQGPARVRPVDPCPPSRAGCSPSPTPSDSSKSSTASSSPGAISSGSSASRRSAPSQLMTAFGAGRTGHILTLPRAELLRQLRSRRKRAAFRGEQTRRERVVTEIRKARLTGIRVAVPVEALDARLSGLPEGVIGRARADRGALQRRERRRRAALRARPGADERLRAVRGARRRGDAGSGGEEVRG